MTDRFDNLPTDELATREAAARAELAELEEALKARLIAECPVKIGKAYKIGAPTDRIWPWMKKYAGRIMWVRYLAVKRDVTGLHPGPWAVAAQGPLLRPTVSEIRYGWAGGRYTSVHPDVLASRLDLSTESDP